MLGFESILESAESYKTPPCVPVIVGKGLLLQPQVDEDCSEQSISTGRAPQVSLVP